MPVHDFLILTLTMKKISLLPSAPTIQIPDTRRVKNGKLEIKIALTGVKNTQTQARCRHPSAPALLNHPMVPGLHLTKTVLHLEKPSSAHPGDLAVYLSKESDWGYRVCASESLLDRVEIYKNGGLLNLIASPEFTKESLSQTSKRELECAVIATVSSYNKTMAPKDDSGTPRTLKPKELPITIHENHLAGDDKTYPDRHIPRKPNFLDYQRYHRLGAPFAGNGKMQPHYHLEFNTPLTRSGVGDILNTLNSMGRVIADREIISAEDIEQILNQLPISMKNERSHLAEIKANRALIPGELETEAQRTSARDYFRGELHALSSANTEKHGPRGKLIPLNNMHMNSFRVIEPHSFLACFSNGYTSLVEDLKQAESIGTTSSPPPSTWELFELYSSFQKAMGDLAKADSVTTEDRGQAEAIRIRLLEAMNKTKTLLAHT